MMGTLWSPKPFIPGLSLSTSFISKLWSRTMHNGMTFAVHPVSGTALSSLPLPEPLLILGRVPRKIGVSLEYEGESPILKCLDSISASLLIFESTFAGPQM